MIMVYYVHSCADDDYDEKMFRYHYSCSENDYLKDSVSHFLINFRWEQVHIRLVSSIIHRSIHQLASILPVCDDSSCAEWQSVQSLVGRYQAKCFSLLLLNRC
jgi:hypothetical protein